MYGAAVIQRGNPQWHTPPGRDVEGSLVLAPALALAVGLVSQQGRTG